MKTVHDEEEYEMDYGMGSLYQALAARGITEGLIGFGHHRYSKGGPPCGYTYYGIDCEPDAPCIDEVHGHEIHVDKDDDEAKSLDELIEDSIVNSKASTHIVLMVTNANQKQKQETVSSLQHSFRYTYAHKSASGTKLVSVHFSDENGMFNKPSSGVLTLGEAAPATANAPRIDVFVALMGQTGIPRSSSLLRRDKEEDEKVETWSDGDREQEEDENPRLEHTRFLCESLWDAIQMDAIWRVIVRHVGTEKAIDHALVSVLGGDDGNIDAEDAKDDEETRDTAPIISHHIVDNPLYDQEALRGIYDFYPKQLLRTERLFRRRDRKHGTQKKKRTGTPLFGLGSVSRPNDDDEDDDDE